MSTRERILLIDADVFLYQACSSCQKEIEFEPGYYTLHSSFEECLETFDASISTIVKTLRADTFKLCLTDSEGNFRKAILPTYKGKRGRKPLVLKALKEFLIQERGAYFKPGLEGDDCMGILATKQWEGNPERVIVSIDKDMMQIPGLSVRWPDASLGNQTAYYGDKFHLHQTLTGDVTDGYQGCPGVGPVKADKILAESGGDLKLAWAAVVRAYEKAGLTEEDALVQARVARILRASDYNFETKEPILWSPSAHFVG